jgi:hypothetical protein
LKTREVVLFGERDRLRCDPRGQVAEPDVTRFARSHDVVERAHGLFDRRRRIESVNLIEVDVIEPEP